jgi:hypothetical protein
VSHACCGGSEGGEARRNAAAHRSADGPALRAVDGLALAASPTFAAMALLTGVLGDPAEMLCSVAGVSPLSGMALMYLLMSVFHAGPWLRLLRARRPV